jgi:uroporphyrinogen-III synthase
MILILRSSNSESQNQLQQLLQTAHLPHQKIFCYEIIPNLEQLNSFAQKIDQFENIIFTSPIAFDTAAKYLESEKPIDETIDQNLLLKNRPTKNLLQQLSEKQIFTVGKMTAETVMRTLDTKVYYPKNDSGIEALTKYLKEDFKLPESTRIAVIKGSSFLENIAPYESTNFICYNRADIFSNNSDYLSIIMSCQVLLVFSSNIAELLINYLKKNSGNLQVAMKNKLIVVIHKNIAQILQNNGINNLILIPNNHDAIIKTLKDLELI